MNPTAPASVASHSPAGTSPRERLRLRPGSRGGPPAEGLPDERGWAALLPGGALPGADLAALNALARPLQVDAGTAVFAQGEPAVALLALVQGAVALGLTAGDGSFRTERLLHAPGWLDLAAGWLGEPHAHTARVLAPARLLELPRDALFALADAHPALWRRLGTVLARELRGLASSTHDLVHKDAPARLAAWLVQHCEPTDALHGLVQLPMRKRDIASQLAITPETLSRLMRSFASKQWIHVAGYTVHVWDRPALVRLAEG